MLGKSTNQKEYQQFVRLVKGKVRQDVTEKPIFLFDGAPPHLTKKSMTLVKSLFVPLRNIPHSCDFNSIESLWSTAKNAFHKLLLLNDKPITEKE